uniref:Fork-head domain-containing protein n=1 Tax=Labrus bergylta TaxID=56723 RepID=A0A3Q3G6K7_9LABR
MGEQTVWPQKQFPLTKALATSFPLSLHFSCDAAVERNPPICPHNSSEDTHRLSKPTLSYLALIAKVILSSPSQKLNLASIYRTMEEQFPYLRSRGPGWRNSVRHNLSVNECFVKVSRCEDGRGHYWGINQAHLRDFQQGNFRVYKKTYLRQFYLSRSFGWEEPQCPLQDPGRYQMCYWDWTHSHYQPWIANVGWVQPARLRLTDSNSKATAVRGHDSETVTSGPLLCREMNDPVLTGMEESYDSRFMTPPVQTFVLPGFSSQSRCSSSDPGQQPPQSHRQRCRRKSS